MIRLYQPVQNCDTVTRIPVFVVFIYKRVWVCFAAWKSALITCVAVCPAHYHLCTRFEPRIGEKRARHTVGMCFCGDASSPGQILSSQRWSITACLGAAHVMRHFLICVCSLRWPCFVAIGKRIDEHGLIWLLVSYYLFCDLWVKIIRVFVEGTRSLLSGGSCADNFLVW
jgi:hypothetical protein